MEKLSIILNWMIFFPILAIERFTDYRIPRLPAYLTLVFVAFAGGYDLLYGTLVYPIYEMAANFSNESLLNSLMILALVKAVEIVGTFAPGLQAIGEIMQHLADYLANGVLALGLQSAFLVIVQKGFFLRYLLGFGLLLLAIPNLADWGKKIMYDNPVNSPFFAILPI